MGEIQAGSLFREACGQTSKRGLLVSKDRKRRRSQAEPWLSSSMREGGRSSSGYKVEIKQPPGASSSSGPVIESPPEWLLPRTLQSRPHRTGCKPRRESRQGSNDNPFGQFGREPICAPFCLCSGYMSSFFPRSEIVFPFIGIGKVCGDDG